MAEREFFEYTYSAPEQDEVKRIRQKYLPKELTKMEQLRALDESVTKRGSAISIAHGVLYSLILGLGMSCCMVWSDTLFIPGIVIGLVGLTVASVAYPLYNRVLKKERERIAPEILRLTDELMK